MKKTLLTILLSGIVFTSVGVYAGHVFTASDIGYQPADSEWTVTNADQALTSLKEDLNTVNTNVTEYKAQITEALAEKGVEVTSTSTMEDITSGIENMSTSKTITVTLSGNDDHVNVYVNGVSIISKDLSWNNINVSSNYTVN